MAYDLNFVNTSKELSETPLAFDNRVCEGGYKLMQRVLILLFKDSDSALIPSLATDILDIVTGNAWSEDQIQNQFNIAANKVTETIQTEIDEEFPEDEQLDTLEIEAILSEADPTYLTLEITIETVSGDAINSTVPYKLTGV